jgi:hypothetical protein
VIVEAHGVEPAVFHEVMAEGAADGFGAVDEF